ncbi:hypothetical protein AGMMS49983_13970 [Clostridia bacterium]|nr:hypothetical protein AGMMS49983_13970 [Clostridia bacterium]
MEQKNNSAPTIENLTQWENECEYQKLVEALEAIPGGELDYDRACILAKVYSNTNRYEDGYELSLRYSDEGENDSVWNWRMGLCLFEISRSEEAIPYLERAIELGDDYEETKNYLLRAKAVIKLSIGRWWGKLIGGTDDSMLLCDYFREICTYPASLTQILKDLHLTKLLEERTLAQGDAWYAENYVRESHFDMPINAVMDLSVIVVECIRNGRVSLRALDGINYVPDINVVITVDAEDIALLISGLDAFITQPEDFDLWALTDEKDRDELLTHCREISRIMKLHERCYKKKGFTMNLPEYFAEAGFTRQAEILAPLEQSRIAIQTGKAEEADFRLGESKIGGQPHLPPDFEWPMYKDMPLAFLAQFNLADVKEFDKDNRLPHSGILYFFYEGGEDVWGYDPKDIDGFKVIHFQGDCAELKMTALPDGVCEYAVLSPCKLQFHADVSYPVNLEDLGLDPEIVKEFETVKREDMDAYDEILEAYEESLLSYADSDDGESGNHQLLGYPNLVQGGIFEECQLVTNGIYLGDGFDYHSSKAQELQAGISDWTLLFQIDSDDNADVMWGDCGMVYFAIKKADLAEGKFDRIWAVFQCG